MNSSKPRRPSPALVVAVMALVAALVGTAVAVPVEISLNKREKKQVRKIATKVSKRQANKRINKRAPNLSVKSAETAGSATNATNAVNAANAGNATTLEGKGASAFVPAEKVLTSGSTVKMSTGETKTILTAGPFRFEAVCSDAGGGSKQIVITLFSTESGSWLDTGIGNGLAIPDGGLAWVDLTNANPFSSGFNAQLYAPSGASFFGHVSGLVNIGSDCGGAGAGIL